MNTVRMELKLHSPASAPAAVFPWPLQQQNGTDGAQCIVSTIQWVCEDFPELKMAMVKNGILNDYDGTSFESMKQLCDRYNRSIDSLKELEKGTAKPYERLQQRPSERLLKHIIDTVYNESVTVPSKLNSYEPFSPETYGETNFKMVTQAVTAVNLQPQEVFIDLGSGVGQVVCQVAAMASCAKVFGIEKADTPNSYSGLFNENFKKWMRWYGKKYTQFELIKGDFLSEEYRSLITSANVVFANNFAFGPKVNHELKLIFAECSDRTRIVSSKPFCSLNHRISERTLNDIGSIMNVIVLPPIKQSVSWTSQPVSFYCHTLDRTKLEDYFQKKKNGERTEDDENTPPLPTSSRRHHHRGSVDSSLSESSRDSSSSTNGAVPSSSPSLPRAPRPVAQPVLLTSSGAVATLSPVTPAEKKRSASSTVSSDSANEKKRHKRQHIHRRHPHRHYHRHHRTTSPPAALPARKKRAGRPPKGPLLLTNPFGDLPSPDTSSASASRSPASRSPPTLASLPVVEAAKRKARGVAAAARRIRRRLPVRVPPETARPLPKRSISDSGAAPVRKRGPINKTTNANALEFLHSKTLASISTLNGEGYRIPVAEGCVDEKLTSLSCVPGTSHNEVTVPEKEHLPYAFQVYLENVKQTMLHMRMIMRTPEHHDWTLKKLREEQDRAATLSKVEENLERQVQALQKSAVQKMKTLFRGLGIQSDTTSAPDYLNKLMAMNREMAKKRDQLVSDEKRLESEVEELEKRNRTLQRNWKETQGRSREPSPAESYQSQQRRGSDGYVQVVTSTQMVPPAGSPSPYGQGSPKLPNLPRHHSSPMSRHHSDPSLLSALTNHRSGGGPSPLSSPPTCSAKPLPPHSTSSGINSSSLHNRSQSQVNHINGFHRREDIAKQTLAEFQMLQKQQQTRRPPPVSVPQSPPAPSQGPPPPPPPHQQSLQRGSSHQQLTSQSQQDPSRPKHSTASYPPASSYGTTPYGPGPLQHYSSAPLSSAQRRTSLNQLPYHPPLQPNSHGQTISSISPNANRNRKARSGRNQEWPAPPPDFKPLPGSRRRSQVPTVPMPQDHVANFISHALQGSSGTPNAGLPLRPTDYTQMSPAKAALRRHFAEEGDPVEKKGLVLSSGGMQQMTLTTQHFIDKAVDMSFRENQPINANKGNNGLVAKSVKIPSSIPLSVEGLAARAMAARRAEPGDRPAVSAGPGLPPSLGGYNQPSPTSSSTAAPSQPTASSSVAPSPHSGPQPARGDSRGDKELDERFDNLFAFAQVTAQRRKSSGSSCSSPMNSPSGGLKGYHSHVSPHRPAMPPGRSPPFPTSAAPPIIPPRSPSHSHLSPSSSPASKRKKRKDDHPQRIEYGAPASTVRPSGAFPTGIQPSNGPVVTSTSVTSPSIDFAYKKKFYERYCQASDPSTPSSLPPSNTSPEKPPPPPPPPVVTATNSGLSVGMPVPVVPRSQVKPLMLPVTNASSTNSSLLMTAPSFTPSSRLVVTATTSSPSPPSDRAPTPGSSFGGGAMTTTTSVSKPVPTSVVQQPSPPSLTSVLLGATKRTPTTSSSSSPRAPQATAGVEGQKQTTCVNQGANKEDPPDKADGTQKEAGKPSKSNEKPE
ncbi:unnamed protein product [Cyprideis torosa]|uniref:Histone-lysine N-methyltransferase, H3 lysine-79 specific n=1 Tax=Cyprideis torosa TaxID=163714 RepID=A0A7R8ZFF0_9CRUS|nr:unnamed protein product [Cyprideis torosa]CAG0878947.1 unnamed protein product [Cyprideis torosa]